MIYDLIIIGGGAAGIAAGIYAARQKLNALLITKEFSGQIGKKAVMIENYPGFEEISGLELMQKFEKQLRKQKIDIERDEVKEVKKNGGVFFVLTGNRNKFESKAVIIASGADPRLLEVPGEKEFLGKGVGYCVTCDGPLFSDKKVAIIGGGNAGFEAAVFLDKIAEKIYILEFGDFIKADAENQAQAARSGKIEVLTNVSVKEIKGEKFVKSLTCQNRATGEFFNLAVDGVFVEIGSQPATSFVKELVDFSERDEIIVNPETLETKTPGLFAAGDVKVGKFKQIVIAAGEGTRAELAATEYLKRA